MNLKKLVKHFRVDDPDKFKIADVDPRETCGLKIEKGEAKAMLAESVKRLSGLQEKLYAQDRWAMLAIFQAMDAGGKDSAIEHVMSGVNPQGCQVHSFKAPSAQELDHDFMWRTTAALPERGRIGIFNRSYYEEVLVVRIHPEILARQKLPGHLVTKDIWKQRFQDIRNFESYLARNGTAIHKFHLRISKDEQRKRFLDRLEEPGKRWKFSMGDVAERELWDKYMDAYEDMIRNTSTAAAPWYVIPADNKRFARLIVAAAMVEAMESLELEFPKDEKEALAEMEKVRQALVAEGGKGAGDRK
jgi:PPK2 family polyphosphate:nucleotide phosphotransferase